MNTEPMNTEELKDQIRQTFSDEDGDSFVFSIKRMGFILSELGHAYINVFKEFLVDIANRSESVADKVKYPLAFFPLIMLIVYVFLR
jgi:hypothetical protein